MILKEFQKRIFTSIILLFLVFFILSYNLILVYSLIVLGIISMMEFSQITKKIIKNKIYFSISNIFFILYVFIFCLMFFFFSNFIELKKILFSLLLSCIASDIGGYIFGKLLKGPKLTKISPNKTLSGALGSLILTGFVLSLTIFYFTGSFNYQILLIALITSAACQIGDLFFSLLKRKAKIKDTGNFLPGHGGVLDRLDGILIGIPVGFTSLVLLF
jgi:phosphatidate cytidylyltransferase